MCGVLVGAVILGGCLPATAGARAPRAFFGIAPQTELTDADASYMRAGGIGSIRWPLAWGVVQPEPGGPYQWRSIDRVVRIAAHHHLRVLPFLCGPPAWAVPTPRALPMHTRAQRRGWRTFARAAVRRYGPAGGFWKGHAVPYLPVRTWQVWNEANFFYFARPVSPKQYGRLFVETSKAIKRANGTARVILSGLFGKPEQPRRKGMPAVRFLAALYRVPGLRQWSDGVSLHPYASHARKLRRLVDSMRLVTKRHRDGSVPLYVTEMGWGSQNDPRTVSFERGLRGQARELKRAYRFLIRSRRHLRIRAVYWFSWKDLEGACSFCDSAGLFYGGSGFVAKPAWRTFVSYSGGKLRP